MALKPDEKVFHHLSLTFFEFSSSLLTGIHILLHIYANVRLEKANWSWSWNWV